MRVMSGRPDGHGTGARGVLVSRSLRGRQRRGREGRTLTCELAAAAAQRARVVAARRCGTTRQPRRTDPRATLPAPRATRDDRENKFSMAGFLNLCPTKCPLKGPCDESSTKSTVGEPTYVVSKFFK